MNYYELKAIAEDPNSKERIRKQAQAIVNRVDFELSLERELPTDYFKKTMKLWRDFEQEYCEHPLSNRIYNDGQEQCLKCDKFI